MLVLNIPEIRACFSLYSSKHTAILKFLPIHIFCPFPGGFLLEGMSVTSQNWINFHSNPCLPSQDRADVSIPHPSRPCFASSGSANHLAIAASLRSGPADFAAGIRGFTRRKSGGRLLPCRYAISWILGGSSSKYTGTCHKPKSPKSARWRNFSMVNKYVSLFYISRPTHLKTYTPQFVKPTHLKTSHRLQVSSHIHPSLWSRDVSPQPPRDVPEVACVQRARPASSPRRSAISPVTRPRWIGGETCNPSSSLGVFSSSSICFTPYF